MSAIHFSDPGKITQLYEHLELFSEGAPARHTIFVLGRQSLMEVETIDQLLQMDREADQLLIIDPPPDIGARFQVEGNVAALFTGVAQDVGLPKLETKAGGVAHIRMGEHFLDIYSQTESNIIHLPAVGVICGGHFGSDSVLPTVAAGSDGGAELDTLRLLAQLVKQGRMQLYIPREGELLSVVVDVMLRLAGDVAYLHGLRRVIPPAVQAGDSLAQLLGMADSLLPTDRRSASCEARHLENLRTIYNAHSLSNRH